MERMSISRKPEKEDPPDKSGMLSREGTAEGCGGVMFVGFEFGVSMLDFGRRGVYSMRYEN